MKSAVTGRLLAQYKSLLQRAILEHNEVLIKQYWQGLTYAKTEHIKALEHDLMVMRMERRRAA